MSVRRKDGEQSENEHEEQCQSSRGRSDCARLAVDRGCGESLASTTIIVLGGICFLGAACSFTILAPEPYMDEVFHVPQTQAYCGGRYGEWDPKITTPPGLYVVAIGYAQLARTVSAALRGAGLDDEDHQQQRCGADVLRQANWLFSVGSLWLMRSLLMRRMAPGKALAHAILLWLYPVSFFFSFLFYTDPGATFFVLLCYLLATGRPLGGRWYRRWGSSLAGTVAILFRQTNAVWLAFILAICLLEDFTPVVALTHSKSADERDSQDAFDVCASLTMATRKDDCFAMTGSSTRTAVSATGNGSLSSSAASRRRTLKPPTKQGDEDVPTEQRLIRLQRETAMRPHTSTKDGRVTSPQDAALRTWEDRGYTIEDDEGRSKRQSLPILPILLVHLVRAAFVDVSRGGPLLRARAPLVIPVLLFAAFVWGFNGGAIVLGDKENHSPGGPPHIAQMAYMMAVGASLWGFVGREAMFGHDARAGFGRWVSRRGALCSTAMVACVALVLWRYSLAHPFLLSDNRHYTFYVWRRFLSNSVIRSLIAPAYMFCGWLLMSRLLETKTSLWVLAYAGASAVVLVPSPLLEPRYLTIPVLLAHLESRERSWIALIMGVAACVVVNTATIYVFLFRPFHWPDGSLARFMW